jgi:signal transduction histidine kinase
VQQLLVELLVNAADAIHPGSGRVTIRTRALPERGMIRIEIADTGRGLPLEMRGDPFAAASLGRPSNKSAGLGLAIVHGVVEDHGGNVTVQTAPETGTTFVIDFPETKGEGKT